MCLTVQPKGTPSHGNSTRPDEQGMIISYLQHKVAVAVTVDVTELSLTQREIGEENYEK